MDNSLDQYNRKRHRTQSADKQNKKSNTEEIKAETITEIAEMGDNEMAEDKTKEMAGNEASKDDEGNANLQDIAKSLESLHKKLDDLTLHQNDTDTDLGNIKTRIGTIEEDSAQCTSDVAILKLEGGDCKTELKWLKNLVIKQSEQIKTLQSECADLRCRSMRNNVLLHNIAEVTNGKEDCETTVRKILDQSDLDDAITLEVDRAHRLGKVKPKSKYPRPIVARFVSQSDAQRLIDYGKRLPKGKDQLKITPQYPSDIYEQRRKMGERIGEVKKESGISKPKIQMTNDKLSINGVTQRETFPTPTPRMILSLSAHEKQTIVKNPPILHQGKPVKESGNIFIASAAKVKDRSQAMLAYRKFMLDPDRACAAHNMAAYRLLPDPGNPSRVFESYQDDGEIGAGRHLRYLLQRRNASNVVVFISRHYSGEHLGARRWELIENAMDSALAEMKIHDKDPMHMGLSSVTYDEEGEVW